jgi:hypothetical protein
MNEAMGKVRDYIALLMTFGMLLFVGFHVAIPDRLWDVYLAVIMFFFGSKTNPEVVKNETTTITSKPAVA